MDLNACVDACFILGLCLRLERGKWSSTYFRVVALLSDICSPRTKTLNLNKAYKIAHIR